MAYFVEYDTKMTKTYFRAAKINRKRRGRLIIVLLLVTVLGCSAVCYKDVIMTYLLPGDAAVTAAALDSMVDGIKNGQDLGNAVTAFCREIIQNASIPQ